MSELINTNEVTEEVVNTAVEETIPETTVEEPVVETPTEETPVEEPVTEDVVPETTETEETSDPVEEAPSNESDNVEEDGPVPVPTENLPSTYKINFTLSYSQYLKAQNRKTITDEEAAALIASVVNHYENEATSSEVREFFEIPESQDNLVQFRVYNITTRVVSNDTTYQVLLVEFTLEFGTREVPADVVTEPLVEKTTEPETSDTEETVEEAIETPSEEVSTEEVSDTEETEDPVEETPAEEPETADENKEEVTE